MASLIQSGRRVALIALLAGALGVPPCSSLADEVYRWVDDQGRVHFSSTPPPRKRVEAWAGDGRQRIQIAPETSATGERAEQARRPAPRSGPLLGKRIETRSRRASKQSADATGEARWRSEANRLQADIERLENQLLATEEGAEFFEAKYEDGHRIHSENKSSRTDRLRHEIEQAQERLDAFEDKAREAGVPPGWLR